MSGFSKEGIVEQLTSRGDGFSKADAIFAANHVDVNWNAEAAESAEGYLDTTSFSKDGLIEQLTSSLAGLHSGAGAVRSEPGLLIRLIDGSGPPRAVPLPPVDRLGKHEGKKALEGLQANNHGCGTRACGRELPGRCGSRRRRAGRSDSGMWRRRWPRLRRLQHHDPHRSLSPGTPNGPRSVQRSGTAPPRSSVVGTVPLHRQAHGHRGRRRALRALLRPWRRALADRCLMKKLITAGVAVLALTGGVAEAQAAERTVVPCWAGYDGGWDMRDRIKPGRCMFNGGRLTPCRRRSAG